MQRPWSTPEQEPAAPLKPVPQGRPSIVLVLEGGGALGLAHVGVLSWMREHHVPVDGIAGTSMGALIGSFAAVGKTPEEIEALATPQVFGGLFGLRQPIQHLAFRRRQDRTEMPQALTFGLASGVSLGPGLISDEALNALLTEQLQAYNSAALSFDQLPIPFRCVATDLTTLEPAIFSRGSLPIAVRSSISIPGVFQPVSIDGHVLVDGAIVENLPTDVAHKAFQPDVLIAVHLPDGAFTAKSARSGLSVFSRAYQAGTSRNEAISRKLATIELVPEVQQYSSADYDKAAELVKAGYVAAAAQRAKLLPYALDAADWTAYLGAMALKQRKPPARIAHVEVAGATPAVNKAMGSRLRKLDGRPFSPDEAEKLVSDIRGGGALDAYYEMFHTPEEPSQSHTDPDNSIRLHWHRNLDGPPYLLIGSDISASNTNVTKTVFDFRLVDQNRWRYGSELRSDVRLGYLTQLGTEYYLPLGSGPFFVQPHAQYLREPIYYWENQKRVSERLQQTSGGGLDLGITPTDNLQLSAQYNLSTVRSVLKEGSDLSPTPHISGTVQTIAGNLVFTNRTAELAAPHGTRLDLTSGYLLNSTQSADAPFLRANLRHSVSLPTNNLLILAAKVDTYFRRDVADPLRFTLGGPVRLSASSVDEYRGTDTTLTQALFLHRIATLPTGLGQGIYLTGGYESGEAWSPERHAILRQDGLAGVLFNTPLGALTVGGSVGDAGHRKVFFTLGRLF